MRKRTAAGVLAVVAAAAGGLTAATSAPTAGAQSFVYAEDLPGNFVGDSREELFSYVSGSTADTLVTFTRQGGPGSDVVIANHGFTVNGLYDPVVGDFDGDGYDEILWYAGGPTVDYLWNFTSSSTVSTKPYTANGNYWPVSGDYTGDGTDDILWYAPGPAQDFVWDYNGGGAGYTSAARTINGYYEPISGSFGSNNTDDILWYAEGSRQDFLWDYNPNGSYTSKAYTASGYYWPFTLDMYGDGWRGEDIFWYAPGPAGDYVWDYVPGGPRRSFADPVNGYYFPPSAGDFLGDGGDDILWWGEHSLTMWDHVPDGSGDVDRWQYTWTSGAGASPQSAPPSGALAEPTPLAQAPSASVRLPAGDGAASRVPTGPASAVPGLVPER